MKRIAVTLLLLPALLLPAAASASVLPPSNPWIMGDRGFMNMAHQGGELEAPSSTIYAFRTALAERGADTLELDVRATADDRLVVIHDPTVDRTTETSGAVKDMTLAEIQTLDAAWWFAPGSGQYDHDLPAGSYPFRGVRTGDRQPPAGYEADDFRIPELKEVLDSFAMTPINIEIKTTSGAGNEGEASRTVALLGELLQRPAYRNRQLIVASLSQQVLEEFHAIAPNIPVSASAASVVSYISGNGVLEPKPIALQVPMKLGDVDPPALIEPLNPWADFLAVHAWTDSQSDENDSVYGDLIGEGVDGIMTMAPGRLDEYLCRAGERRPDGSPRCPEQEPTFTVRPVRRSLKKVLRSGLPLDVSCSVTCSPVIAVRMNARRARKLGITTKPRPIDYSMVQIGVKTRRGPVERGGVTRYWAGIYPHHARKMAKVKKIRLNFSLTFIDQDHYYRMGTWRKGIILR